MDLLTPTTAPRKSLAIPTKTPPAEYRAYVEHPEVATLNQIMLHYLDMEEILKLYRHNHEQFETRQALNTLLERFNLSKAINFKQLLKRYDKTYATVRSYLYDNRAPKEILLQAALEGNIQALYNQLKLYPELRNKEDYIKALGGAAKGGHEAIMELLFELGAEDSVGLVLRYAAAGGQLALVQKELAKGAVPAYIESAVNFAAMQQQKEVIATLLDYSTTDQILTEAMAGAGRSGDNGIIEYVISRGGTDFKTLLDNASLQGRFDIVRQYFNKLTNSEVLSNSHVVYYAFRYVDLEMVKFLVERQVLSQKRLEYSLGNLIHKRLLLSRRKRRTSEPYELDLLNRKIKAVDGIIEYLEMKGIVGDDISSEEYISD